jgi:hypothetical protein
VRPGVGVGRAGSSSRRCRSRSPRGPSRTPAPPGHVSVRPDRAPGSRPARSRSRDEDLRRTLPPRRRTGRRNGAAAGRRARACSGLPVRPPGSALGLEDLRRTTGEPRWSMGPPVEVDGARLDRRSLTSTTRPAEGGREGLRGHLRMRPRRRVPIAPGARGARSRAEAPRRRHRGPVPFGPRELAPKAGTRAAGPRRCERSSEATVLRPSLSPGSTTSCGAPR